jgi:hypothetical protein
LCLCKTREKSWMRLTQLVFLFVTESPLNDAKGTKDENFGSRFKSYRVTRSYYVAKR